MIEIQNLKKSFQGRLVLDIPSLILEPGIRYAIIGANGSGKSTLLKLIAGVIPPDEGSIHIPLQEREALGYMPQRVYAFRQSVLKNVMMALPSTQKNIAREAAMEALKQVGMDHMAHLPGNRLSGGESQRMAFARMLVRPRPFLFLDEPTSAADIKGNDMVEEALLSYHAASGCGMVMATHSLAQASRLAQELLYMDHGILVERGPTKEVLHHPKSPQLQEFLAHWHLKEG